MANTYYVHSSALVPGTKARAEDINSRCDGIEDGFDKLPAAHANAPGTKGFSEVFKIIDATNADNPASAAQVRDCALAYSVDTGAANAYVATLPIATTGYTSGMEIKLKATNTNTGASTINVNGLGVKSIKLITGSPLSGGEIASGRVVGLRYDGTNFVLLDGVIASHSHAGLYTAGRKNYLINGNFDIWQRGTTQTTSGMLSDDRWGNRSSGGLGEVANDRVAFTLGQTSVPGNPKYYSQVTVGALDDIVAGNVLKDQLIEDVSTLSGKTVTLSFWAKADAAKAVNVSFAQNFGTGGSPSKEVPFIYQEDVQLTTDWQRFSVTTTLPSIAGKTLGSDNNSYLKVRLIFSAGDYFETLGIFTGEQTGVFDIAQVQLEEGDTATEYERRTVADELFLCQRYYKNNAVASHFLLAQYAANYTRCQTIFFGGNMRIAPVITLASTLFVGSDGTPGTLYGSNARVDSFSPVWNWAGGTVGRAALCTFTWEANAEL